MVNQNDKISDETNKIDYKKLHNEFVRSYNSNKATRREEEE